MFVYNYLFFFYFPIAHHYRLSILVDKFNATLFQSTTFHVVYKNVPAALTLHWTDGFLLKPFASPTYVFNYNFSQLKGSSDDGNATLKLVFEEPRGSKEVVEQVINLIGIHLIYFFHFLLVCLNFD